MTPTNHSDVSNEVTDLRSALRLLQQTPNQLIVSNKAVNAHAELAAVYRHIGAGTPVEPPTGIGPAMLFENVSGFDHKRVVTGMLASRERTALLMGTTVEQLPFELLKALDNLQSPVTVSSENAPCQQNIIKAPFDIRKLFPAPTNTLKDAGPYFNMGLIRAEDPETGEADVTIHRLCIQGPDLLSVYFVPGRHIDQFRIKAEKAGKPLPVSINMGLDPALYLSACFEAPTTPLGFDELTIAGGLRNRPIELVDCVSVNAKAIAHAEIVLEGEILPGERIREDCLTNTGFAMPEFPGYLGPAQEALPIIKITAVTHRNNPILQTIIGPGEEHVNLAGIPTEASILRLVEKSIPGLLKGVYAHSAGGGKYLAIMQINKRSARDEGRQRQAALTAFAAFSELKHVILVDEDVDLYDINDVMWAMTTRYQGDVSTVFLPGVRCHPLDPSQSPEFSHTIPSPGVTCKTIFDCTVPYHLKDKFERAKFEDVDFKQFISEEFICKFKE